MRTLLFALMFLAFAAPLHAQQTAPAATVLSVKGQPFVESNGGGRKPAEKQQALYVGDVIDVPKGAKVKLRFEDGSVVATGSETRLTIENFRHDQKNRVVQMSLIGGLIRAMVKSFEGTSQFEIKTATGVAAVRSTDLFVEAGREQTRVAVMTGVVEVSSATLPQPTLLHAGEGTRVSNAVLRGRAVTPTVERWNDSQFRALINETTID